MTRAHRGTQRTLLRFTLSYLLLLLVLIVMGIGVYLVSVSIMSEQNVQASLLVLEQAAVRLDSALSEADSFAHTFSSLQSMRRLMLATDRTDAQTILNIRQAYKDMTSFQDSGALVSWYMAYFANADFILEPSNSYRNIDASYGVSFSYGDMSAREWREAVLNTSLRSVTLPAARASTLKGAGRMLVYAKAMSYLTRQMGKLVFFIDEDKLLNLFSSLSELGAEYYVVLGREGEVLSSSGDVPAGFSYDALVRRAGGKSGYFSDSSSGSRMIVTYRQLPSHGWIISSATPYAAVLSRSSQVLMPMLIGIAALLLLGAVLAFWSMQNNRKPLKRTLETLAIGGEGTLAQRGLWQLDQAVHQLVSSRDLLTRRLADQRAALRAAVVTNLESGDALEDDEMDVLLTHVGIQPEGDCFRGVYMTLPDDDDLDDDTLERSDIKRALVMEILEPYAARVQFLSLKGRSCFILLYSQSDGDTPDMRAFFQTLYNAMLNVKGLEPVFYIGTECRALRYLPHSLLAARRLMMRGESSSFMVVAEQDEGDGAGYDYTERHEKRLATFAAMGKEDDIARLLEEIQLSNTRDRRLSRANQQLLFYRMVCTLNEASAGMPLSEKLIFAAHKLDIDQFFDLLREDYMRVCRRNEEKHTEHTARLLTDIMAYLEEHFADYALSLASTAMQFGITEKYLSAFIREKAGISFSSYVEQLRMRKANEYLANTDMTVDDIAQRVGYANGKTFCRAYGRAAGVTPTEYRRANRGAR